MDSIDPVACGIAYLYPAARLHALGVDTGPFAAARYDRTGMPGGTPSADSRERPAQNLMDGRAYARCAAGQYPATTRQESAPSTIVKETRA